ncbi:MAG: hypothetical protein JSU00_19800 [Acidobacteria bacterium]|nr:hypothetical protein [Acidobacteriota bacterium]
MLRRRDLLAGFAVGAAGAAAPQGAAVRFPFTAAAVGQWTAIAANGFADPVPGFIYDGGELRSGLPLGGLGTGYFTIEGNGQIGVSSIFGDLVPPKPVHADWLTIESGTRAIPLSAARIQFWGHYPIADLHAELPEIPLTLGIRAVAPFIPGDAAVSNTPAAIFEIDATNHGVDPLRISLRLRFPAPPKGGSFALRAQSAKESNGAHTVELDLAPGAGRRVTVAVGWSFPSWRDSSSELHVNRYSQRFASADQAAAFALDNAPNLIRRVCAWQAAIYRASLPPWLRDALVQGLYSLAKNSVWIARTRADEWWGDNGWFTHSESHTGCPIVETMVCRIHGHFPLLWFFPELEQTTLAAFRHFQISDGEIPFSFGQPTSMRDPRYHCQHPLNSGQFAQMVHRLFLRTGDAGVLKHFYESAKRAIRYQYTLDDDGCGLVHEQPHVRPGEAWPANQFYDVWPWEGVSSYVAGTWLATLASGRAMAEAAGDRDFAAECAQRLDKARKAFDERLWTGRYYRLWSNATANRSSDVVLANQLMGEWCARLLGLRDVFPKDRVASALATIEKLNMKATAYGLTNGVTPEGEPFDTRVHPSGDFGMNIFVGENLCAAMTFLYHGRRETGVEIARRLYETLAVKTRAPWNQRCLLYGSTGLPLWGDDYYSNLAVWAVPAALEGASAGEFGRGSLVSSIVSAGRA